MTKAATIPKQRDAFAGQNLAMARIIAADPRYSPDGLAGRWARDVIAKCEREQERDK